MFEVLVGQKGELYSENSGDCVCVFGGPAVRKVANRLPMQVFTLMMYVQNFYGKSSKAFPNTHKRRLKQMKGYHVSSTGNPLSEGQNNITVSQIDMYF